MALAPISDRQHVWLVTFLDFLANPTAVGANEPAFYLIDRDDCQSFCPILEGGERSKQD